MVPIGGRPILWHVMKYFAHFGHKQFVICLGFKGEVIKEYFLTYNEALSNDFVLRNGGRDIELLRHDIQDWEITFVDTGLHASIGQRSERSQTPSGGRSRFLANYGDVLTDARMPKLIENHHASGARRKLPVREAGLHASTSCRRTTVTSSTASSTRRTRTSGSTAGYFVFQPEIFDYIEPDEDLVEEPFARLSEAGLLFANKYEGFWAPMDTLKDQQRLEQMVEAGNGPWKVWELDGAVTEEEPSSLESPVERA